MATERNPHLNEIIDLQRLRRSHGEPIKDFYKDWTPLAAENGFESTEAWRRDEFRCDLRWQKKVELFQKGAWRWFLDAKRNLEDDSERGWAGALTDADTAIRCRVDELLKLLNLMPFFVGRNLGAKLEGLKPFGVPTPGILQRWVGRARNRLRHEYINPKRQESQDAVEVAELFLKSTDSFLEKGYIVSATVVNISWFKPAVFAATWFGGELSQSVTSKYGYHDGLGIEYKLEFDLERETITLLYSDKEFYRRCDLRTGKERGRREHVVKEEGPVTIAIRDCKKEEIIDLMILLREIGSEF